MPQDQLKPTALPEQTTICPRSQNPTCNALTSGSTSERPGCAGLSHRPGVGGQVNGILAANGSSGILGSVEKSLTAPTGYLDRCRWAVTHLLPRRSEVRSVLAPGDLSARLIAETEPLRARERIGEDLGIVRGHDRVIGTVNPRGRFSFYSRTENEGRMSSLARPHLKGELAADELGTTVRSFLSTWGAWVVGLVSVVLGVLFLLLSAGLALGHVTYDPAGHHSLAVPFLWVGLGCLGGGLFVFLVCVSYVAEQTIVLERWLANVLGELARMDWD